MAEVIGAISASLHLAQNIVTYFNGVHDAPRHAADLKEELEAVSQVLGLLHEFLLARSQPGSSVRFDRTCVLFSAATGCRRRLKAVDDELAPLLATNTNRPARLWKRLTWPLAREETMQSVRAIHRFAQVFHFATSVEGLSALSLSQHDALDRIEARLQSMDNDSGDQTLQALQEISDAVKDLPGLSSQLTSLTESLSGLIIDNQLSQLLGSIPTLEFQDRHRNLQLTRMEGASQWILGMEKFVEWRDGPSTNGALWCNGAPGAGKTYLASVVVDHLVDVCSQDGNSTGILYFYFDYKKQSDQTPLKLLQTLLHQLLSTHSYIPPKAEEMAENMRRGKGLPSWKEMKTVFIDLCNSSTSRLFIVFDALDECDASANRGPVVELINDIKKSHARLVVTSRPYPPDIDRLFGDCPQILVEASDSDIRAFVLDQIATSDQMSTIIGPSLREKIVTSILAKSQGMFLLPALQINNILGQTSKREIEVALETLPTGLADNLTMTIERIKSQHAQSQTRARLALSVLQWLSTVQRQITASELQHAIAASRLGKNERILDLEDLTHPTFFVDCCFGLVVIDRETQIIRLVHFSVNEYLQEQRGILFDDPDGDVAACCLAYITACATNLRRRAATVTFDELDKKWALWKYATRHWGVHARTCADQRVMDKLTGFFSVPTAMGLWSRHLVASPLVLGDRRDDDAQWLKAARLVAEKTSALHIAAVYGIHDLAVDCLAKDPTSLNAKDDAGATPFMLAAGNGSKAVLELLILTKAIDLNAQDQKGETALLYAIRSHQLEMVQLLLAQSPHLDVNAGDVINTACKTRYWEAMSPDSSAILGLLLKHPAFDLVAQSAFASSDNVAWAALALSSGYDDLGSLIARTDFDAWRRSWPLAGGRRNECMNNLLNTDHDVESFGTRSLVNCSAIALLLDKAFPEIDDFLPLQVAWPMVYYAWGPYVTDNKGEGVSHIDIPCSNIWDNAAETGREELREALEQQAISLDSTDHKGKGFLHFLAYLFSTPSLGMNEDEENLGYLQFLIDRGGPVDVRDHKGRTPLHFAAKEGSEEVVQLLLKAGADPSTPDHSGLTALHYATESDNLSLVRLLLENGADMAATTKQGESVLQFAAQSGATQMIIAFLIGKGASLTQKTVFGETPIMAAMWGHPEAAKALLEFGADPFEASPAYVCALTRAVSDMDVERTKACLAKIKKHKNLSRPDFFGMSILDFLSQFDPAVATEIGITPEHWAAHVPTPPEKRKQNAAEAVGVRLQWMSEADDDTAIMLAYMTGYLLMQAGDDDAARIMFEQGMEPKSKHLSSPYKEYGCSNCYTQFTPQFNCRVCPWVVFCAACVQKAPADRDAKKCARPALKCAGHGFLRIGGEQWKSLPEGKVNKEGQTFREFAKELQCRYPPPR